VRDASFPLSPNGTTRSDHVLFLLYSALGKNIIENTYGIRVTSPDSEACVSLLSFLGRLTPLN